MTKSRSYCSFRTLSLSLLFLFFAFGGCEVPLLSFNFPGPVTPEAFEVQSGGMFSCKSIFPLDPKTVGVFLTCVSGQVLAGANLSSGICKCITEKLGTEEEQCQANTIMARLFACANNNYPCPDKPLKPPSFGLNASDVHFDDFSFDEPLPTPAVLPGDLLEREVLPYYLAITAIFRHYAFAMNTYCFGVDSENAYSSSGTQTVFPGYIQESIIIPEYEGVLQSVLPGKTPPDFARAPFGVLEGKEDTLVVIIRGGQFYSDGYNIQNYLQTQNSIYPGKVAAQAIDLAENLFGVLSQAISDAQSRSGNSYSKVFLASHSSGAKASYLIEGHLVSAFPSLQFGFLTIGLNPTGDRTFAEETGKVANHRDFGYKLDFLARARCLGCAPDYREGGSVGCPASAGGPFPGGVGEKFPFSLPNGHMEIGLKAGGYYTIVPQINNLNIVSAHVCSFLCWSTTALEKSGRFTLKGATDFCDLKTCLLENTAGPPLYVSNFIGNVAYAALLTVPSLLEALTKKLGTSEKRTIVEEIESFRLGGMEMDRQGNVKVFEGDSELMSVWLKKGVRVSSAADSIVDKKEEILIEDIHQQDTGGIPDWKLDRIFSFPPDFDKPEGEIKDRDPSSSFIATSTAPPTVSLESAVCNTEVKGGKGFLSSLAGRGELFGMKTLKWEAKEQSNGKLNKSFFGFKTPDLLSIFSTSLKVNN
uniref:Uncharacterized protein n=1 Tax=Chromera velia CCMP2878 TaxID=1169474 RepID=A0A0G4GWQ8_9ALVE|eukprot:Cvel_23676.t1-p1 / transcript=Cvel_23676.t1 / gene=Cvel_23676 / organism=Chromera_velia_CCMP2878 / gene_product=hypothetical protein / transcript_product=hypothetical protein / location=Cvel_scaffold2467:18175-22994(+) / protein_length=700 / sequence_SO=supercontig / SO=protein_coding / is_pseudo=false